MIVCGGGGIVCLLVMILLRRHPVMEKIQSPCRMVLIFCIMGCLAEAAGYKENPEMAQGEIERNEPGEGDREAEAFVYLQEENTEYPLTLTIEERKYHKKEEEKLLAAAKEEIKQTFCGTNVSMDQIRTNPVVLETYQNGKTANGCRC